MGGMDRQTALRHAVGLSVLLASSGATLQVQPAAPPPAFEVASENVSASDNAPVCAQPGGRVTVTNNTLRNVIGNAYNVQNYQIVGGPDWITTIRRDITAKAPGDAPPQQLLLMLADARHGSVQSRRSSGSARHANVCARARAGRRKAGTAAPRVHH
jgi:hypothetical protein